MRNGTRDQIVEKAKKAASGNIEAFAGWLDEGTRGPDGFASITEMERRLREAQTNAELSCRDLLGDWLSNVDESGLIERKKANTGKRE